MFNNIQIIVKPADKRHRAYKRMLSARLHRGFQMTRSPKKEVYQQAQQQETRLNVSSGEDAFLEMPNALN